MGQRMTPAEFSEKYGISRAVITRCKQRGAPVQYYGTCGRMYWIPEEEFLNWMNAQGQNRKEEPRKNLLSLSEMRDARHRLIEGAGG